MLKMFHQGNGVIALYIIYYVKKCIQEQSFKVKQQIFLNKNKKRIKLPRSEWIVVPNMHEPIIDEELGAVQDSLKKSTGK